MLTFRFHRLIIVLLIAAGSLHAQVKMCSWNIQNFGKSKSDSLMQYMAGLLKDFDLVAVVEVVAGNGGAQAVARLADELNRKGSKWDYCVSDPTNSLPGRTERYAFLWKTARLSKKGDGWLDRTFEYQIEREPYLARFEQDDKDFALAVFHALPKQKQPETEIKYFKYIPQAYPGENILFCGDFNCPQSHTVFNPLKQMNYRPALVNQKTSLKNSCVAGQSLASEYDNIFYDSTRVQKRSSGVIEFYRDFSSLREARRVSDHLPVYMEFYLR